LGEWATGTGSGTAGPSFGSLRLLGEALHHELAGGIEEGEVVAREHRYHVAELKRSRKPTAVAV
jgi:hypothetical protein